MGVVLRSYIGNTMHDPLRIFGVKIDLRPDFSDLLHHPSAHKQTRVLAITIFQKL